MMRTVWTLLTIFCLAASSSAGDPAPPFVDLSFSEARELASEQGKAVLVDFFTTWCGPCKRLDAETWTDPNVLAWLEARTIPLKLDAEIESDLAKRYAVRGYPTILFVDSDGTEIERLIGFLSPADFLEQAGVILDAGSTDQLIELRREIAYESGAPARLEYIKLLLRHERHEQAFAELVWCYDVGMGQGSVFRGARNSRVLAEFARLAEVYEPAHQELDRRAIAILRRASRGRASTQELVDLSSLNAAIGRQDRSLKLIDRITERSPDSESLQTLYQNNFQFLLEAKRYGDLAERFPPRDSLIDSARRWSTSERRISQLPNDQRADRRQDEQRREVGRLVRAFEIALGSSQQKLAGALQERSLELAPDDWYTYFVLAGARSRAEGPSEHALEHSDRSLALLVKDDETETVSPITQHARLLHEHGRTAEALELLDHTRSKTADAALREALGEAMAEIQGG